MNTVNLYRAQQLAISAAIDSGDYGKASDLLRQDLQTFAPQEQSAQTGHNQTLTPRRKCGIIKAMRRVCRQIKRRYNNMEHIVKVVINGETAGTIRTNRSLTVSEAMWALGYDINDSTDIKRGYNEGIPGFYLDDCGNYQFDEEAARIIY